MFLINIMRKRFKLTDAKSQNIHMFLLQYPLVAAKALLDFFMVMFRHTFVKVKERSWSWLNTERVESDRMCLFINI